LAEQMSPNHGAPRRRLRARIGRLCPQPLWRELFGDHGTIAIVWVFASHQGAAAIAASGAVVSRDTSVLAIAILIGEVLGCRCVAWDRITSPRVRTCCQASTRLWHPRWGTFELLVLVSRDQTLEQSAASDKAQGHTR